MQEIVGASERPRSVPAWLLSAGFHLVLMLLLPFALSRSVPSQALEQGRSVAIVLARTDASESTQYFSESDAEVADESTEGDAETEQTSLSLPASAAESLIESAEISLPTASDLELAGQALVQTPELTVSGRSRVPTGLDPSAILAEQTARLQARAARGPTTNLGLFGSAPAVGRSFVFLIDRSKSMGGQGLGALLAAEKELAKAVARLGPTHRFQVIAYHHQCVYMKQRKLLPATLENTQAIQGHLSGLAAFGATEHKLAMIAAISLEPDVIFLLTDGGDPRLVSGEIAQITRLAGGRTTIHCIQFGRGPLQDDDPFMRRLAEANGGSYGYVDMSQAKSR